MVYNSDMFDMIHVKNHFEWLALFPINKKMVEDTLVLLKLITDLQRYPGQFDDF